VLRSRAQNLVIVKIKRPYHHGALRDALVDAAAQLLTERGPSGVTLREVARRAGVSQAAPYHYFDSKAALILAVADAGFATLDAQQAAALARAPHDPVARLNALVVTHIRFALEHPHYFNAMTPHVSDRFADVVREARVAAGHDDLDPTAIATLIWAVPHGLLALHLDRRGTRAETTPVEIERLARTAVNALVAIPPDDVAAEWAV
jgi:AcrR family transcriptional regulator